MRRGKLAFGCIFSILFFCIPVVAPAIANEDPEKSGPSNKLTSQFEAQWNSQAELVRTEVDRLKDHPWAGTYYFGDGQGTNVSLTLAPSNGFIFAWTGSWGYYDAGYGIVSCAESETLLLQFVTETSPGSGSHQVGELLPVAWGERNYLVPTSKMLAFCNAVNSGSEPRSRVHGSFLLRRKDHELPVNDFPSVPRTFQQYLLHQPVSAQVLDVEATTIEEEILGFLTHHTRATLDAGAQHGVLPGMLFHPVDDAVRSRGPGAKVVSVGELSCQVEFEQFVTCDEVVQNPEVGWKVATRRSSPTDTFATTSSK